MAEADTRQVWLVERDSRDDRLISLVYATPDGEQAVTRERSMQLLRKRPATAAVTVDPGDLVSVEDSGTRERYAAEASRMAERHGPDDQV
jgi:hypothetical protein